LPSRALRFALVSCAILAGAFVPASAQAMTACEAVKPTIEHVGMTEITPAGVMLEAQINPQNSATTYEFVIVQQLRNPENPSDRSEPAPEDLRAVGGPIPAGAGDVAVGGLVAGLERGYTYWYEVVASNLAGETRFGEDNSFSDFYTGGYPYGIGGAPFRAVSPSPCAIELAQQEAGRIAARTEAERRQSAREREELLAKEATARYAAEAAALKRREEEESAADAKVRVIPKCTVPSLKHDTLSAARRALVKAHCRLGKVSKPKAHHHGQLVVTQQRVGAGGKLPSDTRIGVTLGRPLRRR
jgi:hypothetical protein